MMHQIFEDALKGFRPRDLPKHAAEKNFTSENRVSSVAAQEVSTSRNNVATYAKEDETRMRNKHTCMNCDLVIYNEFSYAGECRNCGGVWYVTEKDEDRDEDSEE